MKEIIKKYRVTIIVLIVVILLVCTVFILKQIQKKDSQTWKKLGYEKTEVQNNELKIYQFAMDYCDACSKVAPIYDKIKSIYSDKIDFEYIDVNLKPNLANKYNINIVPTFVIINKKGEPISRISGAITFEEFERFIVKSKEVYDGSI
ncbi:MAG: thioredoxin family protein [Clostridia bacterium]